MSKTLLIFIVALLLIVVGGTGWEIIRPKVKALEPVIHYETLVVDQTDTIRVISPPKVYYRDRVVTQIAETPKDSCCTLLERCWLDQFWLSNLETEVEKTVEGGSITAQWSTPAYLESGNGFHIEARFTPLPAQVVEIEKPRSFWNRFGYGLHGTAGMDTQGRPAAVVGVGLHFDAKGLF